MSKFFKTKKHILEALSGKNMTLTELSQDLGLAASTVSQHIRELIDTGEVEHVDNPWIKRWKYYRIRENDMVIRNRQ